MDAGTAVDNARPRELWLIRVSKTSSTGIRHPGRRTAIGNGAAPAFEHRYSEPEEDQERARGAHQAAGIGTHGAEYNTTLRPLHSLARGPSWP